MTAQPKMPLAVVFTLLTLLKIKLFIGGLFTFWVCGKWLFRL